MHASFLNPLRRFHRALLPLMPMALEAFDLRGYDLVISSESGPAKGVIASATCRHLCYCHTPMRYLWELYPAYRNEFGPVGAEARALMAPVASYLRIWDYRHRRPRGPLRRQQLERPAAHLEDLPAGGAASSIRPCRSRRFYTMPPRTIPDRLGAGAV